MIYHVYYKIPVKNLHMNPFTQQKHIPKSYIIEEMSEGKFSIKVTE